MFDDQMILDRILRRALEEDLGSGDLTTNATIDPGLKGRASLLARETLVLAGLPVFINVFRMLSVEITSEDYF